MLPATTPARVVAEDENFGRIPIYTDVTEITGSNILDVLSDAYTIHERNAARIDYLWKYYKGQQGVLNRTKEIRPEINNKIVENRANEIVSFKVGYLFGEPVQYVSHSEDKDDELNKAINLLNNFMAVEDKAAKDKELADWNHIGGTAYRVVLPSVPKDKDNPFQIYIPDPRFTFVVYSSAMGHAPLMGVQYLIKGDGTYVYSCWTKDALYEVVDGKIKSVKPHIMGMVPVLEYPLNTARLGAFEIVLTILDAINNLDSDRMDGVDQFIQSIIKFINCDIDEQSFTAMKQLGAIKVKTLAQGMPADVEIMTQELDQGQSQTLKEDLHQTILDICGMPNRNGGSSTSDTGSAVIMRDGWSAAEARAKDTELMFKRSERQMLKLVLRILRIYNIMDLTTSQIEMAFTRRNYSDLLTKSQVLTTMLDNPHIHPQLAFTSCGMFVDSEAAYAMSQEYYEEQMKKQAELMDVEEDDDDAADVRQRRQTV